MNYQTITNKTLTDWIQDTSTWHDKECDRLQAYLASLSEELILPKDVVRVHGGD